MQKRTKGTVRWFDGSKGFGVIECDESDEVFVHYSDIRNGVKNLLAGQRVEFTLEHNYRGPLATSVNKLQA
jgi:CspA family cold shock protein